MKYLLILLIGSIGFLEDVKPSKVKWLIPTEHDFGDIPRFEPVAVDFKFVNVSGAPLLIDNVRTTCGCTAPDWPKTPIETSDTSSIKITFSAKKKGYFRKKVKVFFDGQRKGEVLYVEGFVEEVGD